VIYPLALGSGPLTDFRELADGSGGTVFEASGWADVATQILNAVDQAAIPLYTSLTVSSPARPGAPVAFSAAGSYYDAGEITGYGWDFDGDGTVDQTTAENRTAHIYTAPFSGIASVTVSTDDGHQGTVTAEVEISADAPVAPARPPA
jgi:PKD repeat protein